MARIKRMRLFLATCARTFGHKHNNYYYLRDTPTLMQYYIDKLLSSCLACQTSCLSVGTCTLTALQAEPLEREDHHDF